MRKSNQRLEVGDVAVSRAGHDAGRYYLVIAETGEDFVLVCDGRYRKADDPKVKRRKHLVFVAKAGADIGADDKAIAAALRQYSSSEE